MQNLTKTQRRMLELAWRFHTGEPPTVGELIEESAVTYALTFVVCVMVSIGLFAIDWPTLGAYAFGLVMGIGVFILTSTIAYVRNWPMTNATTNWEAVEALVRPPTPADTPAAPPELKP